MEIIKKYEINSILKSLDKKLILVNWFFEEFTDKVMGTLSDHFKLILEVTDNDEKNANVRQIQVFVKCMPRFDEWKANYLRDMKFFMKEYVMLSSLFKEFQNYDDELRWRPKLLYIREDLFVFEDVYQSGYRLPNQRETLTMDELKATVNTLATFHAQSFIYEENLTKKLQKPYRLWEDYKEYLQEPTTGGSGYRWRMVGRNAVIDYLKVFSKYRLNPNFSNKIEVVIHELFQKAFVQMRPSTKYRNTVIHRDLWANNIFIAEKENGDLHAMFVDFQTVLYCNPMLDLSSMIYFNTVKSFRDKHTIELIDIYYGTLTEVLLKSHINVNEIFPRDKLLKAYKESLIFAVTQACLVVPVIAMDSKRREAIFGDPERSQKCKIVSRSEEFIETAIDDNLYRERVTDLLDDIVEMFVYPEY